MWNKKRDNNGLRLLVAEDDPHDQLLFAMAAEDWNGEVSVAFAGDGVEILEMLEDAILKKETPAFVVLDLRMPRLDGHDTLERIRTDPQYDGVDVVVFSSSAHPDDVEKSLRRGAIRHEVKPSTYQELIWFMGLLHDLARDRSASGV